jgi:cyclic pyranopterin phosphate synthase
MGTSKLDQVKDELQVVEMEVNSRCNRKCSYCPVSTLPAPDAPRIMPEEVLGRTIVELQRIEFARRISYHFYNEPLLRRDLPDVATRVKKSLPNAQQVLFTNGDLLDDAKYSELTGAGVDFIVVTAHSGKQHPKRPKQHVQYPEELELTNRGGVLTHLPPATDETLKSPCFAPSEMLIITATGDVVLCYEDASRRTNYGNIVSDKIEDIWLNPELVRVRKSLAESNRSDASPICKACTNLAHIRKDISDRSEPFWAKIDF